MKMDLSMALVVSIALVCVCIFAVLFYAFPLAVKFMLGIMGLCLTWMLVWFVIQTIKLRNYEKIYWYEKMGMCETVSFKRKRFVT